MNDFELLEKVGLNQYERQTLIALLRRGVADAATLCTDGEIPTSKIYQATEKLARMGLITIQPSRPKVFAALSPEDVVARLGVLAREEAERFAHGAEGLLDLVRKAGEEALATKTFADLALGADGHVQRHVVHLASAARSIVSYMESPDLDAISQAKRKGLPVLRRIRNNAEARGVRHRVVFGFAHRDAPKLIEFLRAQRNDMRAVTGVRYAGVLGHPFHVVDDDLVILSLDNAFLPERRFASIMIRNENLAVALKTGFEGLWEKAMRSLTEIDVHPGAFSS